MSTNPSSQRKFGTIGVALLIAAAAWLPAIDAKIYRYRHGPGEYMELDLILPMIWMGAWSLGGIGFCAYAMGRAEEQKRPLTAPVLLGLVNAGGLILSAWYFCH